MDAIDKINALLARKGITGAELERKIGVSNSVYSQWNTKATKPSNKSLAKVAEALGVDVLEILPDNKKEPTATNGSELTEEEVKFLEWFRSQASEKDKALVRMIVEGE